MGTEVVPTVPGAHFIDPAMWADMEAWHEQVGQWRRNHGAVWVEPDGYQPFLALLGHDDVFNVSRDSVSWNNTSRSVLGPIEQYVQMEASGMPAPASLVHLDGTKHRDHRQVANDWFKPASVGKRQPRISELAERYVQRMADLGGECDFARDIAQPYTLRVIMDIYGVPEEDEPMMMDLTQGVFGAADPEFLGDADDPQARVLGSIMNFIQYFNEMTTDRQACPRDDLASVIANGQIDGCPLGDVERLWYYIIVATAGHDTTSFALAGGLEALLANPEQLAALQANHELIPNTAEEFIRWTTPVRHFMRFATVPMTVASVEIPVGGSVLLSYPSANRDETVFVDPDRFIVDRPDADKLMSFGVGSHFCLGSQFARRELRSFLAALLPRLKSIEPAGDASWAQSHFVSGVKHLPIRYTFA